MKRQHPSRLHPERAELCRISGRSRQRQLQLQPMMEQVELEKLENQPVSRKANGKPKVGDLPRGSHRPGFTVRQLVRETKITITARTSAKSSNQEGLGRTPTFYTPTHTQFSAPKMRGLSEISSTSRFAP